MAHPRTKFGEWLLRAWPKIRDIIVLILTGETFIK
jgi:hypothetical protein